MLTRYLWINRYGSLVVEAHSRADAEQLALTWAPIGIRSEPIVGVAMGTAPGVVAVERHQDWIITLKESRF